MAKACDDLDGIYRSLKTLLMEFESPKPGLALQGRSSTDGDFDLWSVPDQTSEDPACREVYFAGIRKQKSCVGFYFLPVHTAPAVGACLAPPLRRLLKGKSCFQVRTLDGGLLDHIRTALDVGLEEYQGRGWA